MIKLLEMLSLNLHILAVRFFHSWGHRKLFSFRKLWFSLEHLNRFRGLRVRRICLFYAYKLMNFGSFIKLMFFFMNFRNISVDKLILFVSFFTDAKNALLLHLLPVYIKPTGRPQRTIATAQSNFVVYTHDASSINEPDKHAPYILIVTEDAPTETDKHKHKEKIKQILVYGDKKRYECSSVLQALAATYHFIWLFEIEYEKSVINCWMVIQKYFFNMTFDGELCSPAANKLIKSLPTQASSA